MRVHQQNRLTIRTVPGPEPITAGVDEVGRGPLAGPVIAAAVILGREIAGIRDSKLLSRVARERLAAEIVATAWFGIGAASAAEIDRLNILQATMLAMRRAVARLPLRPAAVLVDGNRSPDLPIATSCIIDGDALVPAIGAASILAKVVRDRLMGQLGLRYPGYGFATNAGYGTPEHLSGLERYGPTIHHRWSFAPVRLLGVPRSRASSRQNMDVQDSSWRGAVGQVE